LSTLLAERKGAMHIVNAGPRTLIKVTDVSIWFGKLQVLDSLGLSIREGEFLSLLGPSGCGKSTLLKAIGGLVTASEGTIHICDPGLRLGLMFQKPLLLPWRTTHSNVLLPLELGRGATLATEGREKALRMLELVRLADFRDAYPHQLSGGMQQRAALARTLMQDPDVLLLDEPFGALDELTRELLNEELIGIWMSGATRLKTIVMVTHSIPEAITMSDRIAVMTPRPARLADTIELSLPRPREADDKEVGKAIAQVRRLIRGTL
jgi:NitT/TauT family transport system ATP-binding protein